MVRWWVVMDTTKTRIGRWEGRALPWRDWFAWYPVRLGKVGRLVWMCPVRRRPVTCNTFDDFGLPIRGLRWEYREKARCPSTSSGN